MCPGGQVIGSRDCSRDGDHQLHDDSGRSGELANSRVRRHCAVGRFCLLAGYPLGGLVFRQTWEEKRFRCGGGDYRAPRAAADRLYRGLFIAKSRPTVFTGVRPRVSTTYCPRLSRGAAGWNPDVDRKNAGICDSEAHLIGWKRASRRRVRIVRRDNARAKTMQGLYPCGEGAGYAGRNHQLGAGTASGRPADSDAPETGVG
jgi:uncharacterized FAD-dependent dehydrogenase